MPARSVYQDSVQLDRSSSGGGGGGDGRGGHLGHTTTTTATRTMTTQVAPPAQIAVGPGAAKALGLLSPSSMSFFHSTPSSTAQRQDDENNEEAVLIDTRTQSASPSHHIAVVSGAYPAASLTASGGGSSSSSAAAAGGSSSSSSGRATAYAVYRFLEELGFVFLAHDETQLPSSSSSRGGSDGRTQLHGTQLPSSASRGGEGGGGGAQLPSSRGGEGQRQSSCPSLPTGMHFITTPAFQVRDSNSYQVVTSHSWDLRAGYNGQSTNLPMELGGHEGYAGAYIRTPPQRAAQQHSAPTHTHSPPSLPLSTQTSALKGMVSCTLLTLSCATLTPPPPSTRGTIHRAILSRGTLIGSQTAMLQGSCAGQSRR